MIFLLFIVLYFINGVKSINCNIGYGQRGRLRDDGIDWPRSCPDSTYCWEATTRDVSQMEKLIDSEQFGWDTYYREYYIHGCGGAYGTPLLTPCQFIPIPKYINITTPIELSGKGGTVPLHLKYCCNKDFCSSAWSLFKSNRNGTTTFVILLTVLVSILLANNII